MCVKDTSIITKFTSVMVTVVCKSLPSLLKTSWGAVLIRNCQTHDKIIFCFKNKNNSSSSSGNETTSQLCLN